MLTHTGDPSLWAPFRGDAGSLVAVAGRPVFDEAEWAAVPVARGRGGLAARMIDARYEGQGAAGLERLNGNCVVIVHDETRRVIHLVTDRCGVFPSFEAEAPRGWTYCSHPDVLADAAGQRESPDEVSLAEFILTGTVTPPYSYYQHVRAADHGTTFTFDLASDRPLQPSRRRYFEFVYRGDSIVREKELADELALALRRAVERRTLPRLGRSVVALSGGLDSRVVLASTLDRPRTLAFSCYDAPNIEMRTAQSIARTLSVPWLPLQRTPDYYADHAERGVQVSGGMGSLANNHFLGVLPRLKSEGMEGLLTGCYCDYLFKGLPLNRRAHWLSRREELAPFQHHFYFDHVSASSPLSERAIERLDSRVPHQFRSHSTDADVFEVEARRTFPLCYEGDNQQRVVPQRLAGWCPPFVDRDVIDIYCRVPFHFKLNRSLFRKAALSLAPELRAIPDANTGARVDAPAGWEWLRGSQLRLQLKWQRMRGSIASGESWPNWQHYVRYSPKLDALWKRPNRDAMDLFRRVLGPTGLPDDQEVLKREQPFLFVSLLTLKLWLDQRA